LTYLAYKYCTVTYLVCEDDQTLPVEMQRMMVEKVRKTNVKVMEESCGAGHSPFLSHPDTVVNVIERMSV
jgi:pimeloyl-ACP methyl ester carboxylesterase